MSWDGGSKGLTSTAVGQFKLGVVVPVANTEQDRAGTVGEHRGRGGVVVTAGATEGVAGQSW